MSYSVVIQFRNQFGEVYHGQIFDSPTRAGASKKAGTFLKGTFGQVVSKARVDNYEYWHVKDIADIKEDSDNDKSI